MPARIAPRSAGDRSRSIPTNAISFVGLLPNIARSLQNAAWAEGKPVSTPNPTVQLQTEVRCPLLSPLSSANDGGHVFGRLISTDGSKGRLKFACYDVSSAFAA